MKNLISSFPPSYFHVHNLPQPFPVTYFILPIFVPGVPHHPCILLHSLSFSRSPSSPAIPLTLALPLHKLHLSQPLALMHLIFPRISPHMVTGVLEGLSFLSPELKFGGCWYRGDSFQWINVLSMKGVKGNFQKGKHCPGTTSLNQHSLHFTAIRKWIKGRLNQWKIFQYFCAISDAFHQFYSQRVFIIQIMHDLQTRKLII